jgi:ATP-dependent Clp protease ATP-binding subunit ClpB
MFRPLTLDHMEGIIHLQFEHLEELLKKQDISFEVSDRCVQYLKNTGFNLQFGARPLKRLMQKKVLDGLSMAMLSNEIAPGMHIRIDAEGDRVLFKPLGKTPENEKAEGKTPEGETKGLSAE